MTQKTLDDAVSEFWGERGAPEGAAFNAFIAQQPTETIAAWRAFLVAELEHWEFEYKTGYQNERNLMKDGYEVQSERAGIAAAEAHANADDCREMLKAVSHR